MQIYFEHYRTNFDSFCSQYMRAIAKINNTAKLKFITKGLLLDILLIVVSYKVDPLWPVYPYCNNIIMFAIGKGMANSMTNSKNFMNLKIK